MCNRLFAFIRNLWMPVTIKKEIDQMHQNTIRWLWDEIYEKMYEVCESNTIDELIIKLPLDRIYEIDGYWKKYNYDTLDFYFYKLKLNTVTHYTYKSIPIKVDFYSDGSIGFLEVSRKS
jgi:hypothetical protein